MASNNSGNENREEKESAAVSSRVKELRKRFCADGTMDRLKSAFEECMKNNPRHQENIKMLHTLMDSRNPSYEEVFAELGGPQLKTEPTDDLDTLLKKLTKSENMTLTEEEKEELFKVWDAKMQR